MHFSRVQKIGINPKYNWDFTPAGLYAKPAEEAIYDLESSYFYKSYKYATLLIPSDNSKILNLSTANQYTLDNLMRLAYNYYKKKEGIDDKRLQPILGQNAKETWNKIIGIFVDLWHKDKRSPFYWNSIVRKLGYNVLMDNHGIINEEYTTQIVFLTPDSYRIIAQEPIRLTS